MQGEHWGLQFPPRLLHLPILHLIAHSLKYHPIKAQESTVDFSYKFQDHLLAKGKVISGL